GICMFCWVAVIKNLSYTNVACEQKHRRVADMIIVCVGQHKPVDYLNPFSAKKFQQGWTFSGVEDDSPLTVTEDRCVSVTDVNDCQIGRGLLQHHQGEEV